MALYRYGKAIAEVTPANGIRVYHTDSDFTDYTIRHDDLEVIIASDAMASFYKIGQYLILDHSPEVLGLEKAEDSAPTN